MANVVILVDGVDITADVMFSTAVFSCLADGNVGTARFVVEDKEHTYTPADFRTGMTLELFIDDVRQWDGWVFTVRRGWPLPVDDSSVIMDVERHWAIEGLDRNLLFQKRILYRLSDPTDDSGLRTWPADTPDDEVLWYYLDNYVEIWDAIDDAVIENVGSPGPFEEFTLGFVSAPMGVAFDDAAKMTGAVFAIGPDRALRYHDDLTTTAPFGLSDQPADDQVGYREFEIIDDFTDGAATEALVWGAGRGSDEPVFAKYTGDFPDVVGKWQWGEVFIGAWHTQTVLRRARTYVEGSPNHRRGHGDPVPIVTCTIFEPGLMVGDVVDFWNALYGYQESLPLRSMTITFPTTTLARFDLQMTLRVDTPFGVPDLWDFEVTIPPIGSIDPTPMPTVCFLLDTFSRSVGDDTDWGVADNDTGQTYTWTDTIGGG